MPSSKSNHHVEEYRSVSQDSQWTRPEDTDYHRTSTFVPEKPESVKVKQEFHSLPSPEALANPAEPLPNPEHGYSAAQSYRPAPGYFSAHGYPPAAYSTQGYYAGLKSATDNPNTQDRRPQFNPSAAYSAQNYASQASLRPFIPQDFLQRTSFKQAPLLLDTENQVTVPPSFIPESENHRTKFTINLRSGQHKLIDEEKGLGWGLQNKAQGRGNLPCRAETDPVFTQKQTNVKTLNFLSSKRAVPEDDGKDVIILTVNADETEWEQSSDDLRAYQWRHMDSQQLSFNAFELLALRLPGLCGDDITVVRQLLERVWRTYGREYGHGSYLESGTMCCDSNSVLRGSEKRKPTATFFCLPYFSIDELQVGTDHEVKETSLHPIRTLLQYRYRSFPKPERDFQTWQPCKERILHVPQIWGLIINSTHIVTAAPQTLVELRGKHIQLNTLVQLSQTTKPSLIQFFDGTGRCHYFPVQQCMTWNGIMKAVESTMPRVSTAQELHIRKFLLMGAPVTDRTWSSALQAETSTVVSLRMTLVYPQHQTGIYNTRTGFHETPMEPQGPTARHVISANESLNAGPRKAGKQRNSVSEVVLKLAEKKHGLVEHGKEKQKEKQKDREIRTTKRKKVRKAALNGTNSLPSETASSSDSVWAPALEHLFSGNDVPAIVEPERGRGSDRSTPGDSSLHSQEELGGKNLIAELKTGSASERKSAKDSSSQSEEEIIDSALIRRLWSKPAPREYVVEEWLLYPDTRLDDLQAQSWFMQQPVGPPTWSTSQSLRDKNFSAEVPQKDDATVATTSYSTDEYMFPVFTWLCGVRISKAKEGFQSSHATNRRIWESTLDILHMDMSRSTYAQKGWGKLEQVEGDLYNDLAARTQLETETLGFYLRNSAGFQEKHVILKRAKRLSNFFIPNNWTCEFSNKYWGAVFKIMTSADVNEGHPLLNQCSRLLKCLLKVADGIQHGVNACESPQVPSNIRLAFSKAYRSIVMLFINVASLKAPDRTHELELQRAGMECLQLMEKGKYHLMEVIHLDGSSENVTSEAVSVETVMALVVDRSIEGFGALDNSLLDLYANHIERLELQVRGNPKRRLLRDINTTIEELETITTILARQGKTLNDFLQLLRYDVSPHSSSTQRLDVSTIEQTMRKDWKRLEEARELQKRASGLVYQLRQSLEILNDDHGKAILVFTVVTIIFLPLSFVTSFLGMNTSDIRNQTSGQGLFWTIAIPLALFVTLIALGMAFRDQIGQGFEDLLAAARKRKRS